MGKSPIYEECISINLCANQLDDEVAVFGYYGWYPNVLDSSNVVVLMKFLLVHIRELVSGITSCGD